MTGEENPNFIFILADDLGYGEIGIQGQKWIETPNIDQLAKEGMILTNHYSGAPVCAPARAVLMTGLHTGKNPVRGNSEWSERGEVWSFKAMFENPNLEGQRPMPDSIFTIASVFKSQGYKTGMVGKWGLGAPNTNSIPNKKGFDFSMATIVSGKLTTSILLIYGEIENVTFSTIPLLTKENFQTIWIPMMRRAMPFTIKMTMPQHLCIMRP